MTLQELIKAAQQLSLQDQIRLVSQLVQTLEQELQASITAAPLQVYTEQQDSNINPQTYSLKGKVKYYDAPYKSVAFKDWDALA